MLAQLAAVIAVGLLQQFGERGRVVAAGTPGGGVAALARHLEADRGGQFLDRVGEAQVLVLHEEADGAAVGAAAEAVVELLGPG
jgi:hypothetical protein